MVFDEDVGWIFQWSYHWTPKQLNINQQIIISSELNTALKLIITLELIAPLKWLITTLKLINGLQNTRSKQVEERSQRCLLPCVL